MSAGLRWAGYTDLRDRLLARCQERRGEWERRKEKQE